MPTTTKFVPEIEDLPPVEGWQGTEEEQKRGRRIAARVHLMLQERGKYEDAMERSLLLYSGKSRDLKDPRKEKVVIPFARVFVEAKTSEEVKAMNTYEFESGKEPSDEWKVDLIKDVDKHIRRRVKMGPKKIQALRMKNICGVSILRLGYRKVMRVIRDRKFGQEDGDTLEYTTREVPVYDDLYVDLVSPFNFAIDPNATTMDDAMDCVHFHTMSYQAFHEAYSKLPGIKNIDAVRPGKDGNVDIAEYFNKIGPQGDEWVMLVMPSGTLHARKWSPGNVPRIEIYEGPLPDDHKELPFVSYHNNSSFISAYVKDNARSADGTEAVQTDDIRADEGFWTEGDPVTMMDLIDLRTGFGRAAFKALKRASSYVVATAPGFVFDDSRPWRDGDQAPGAKDKFTVTSLGEANIASFQFAYDDLFNLMILLTGIDPRNLTENKTKTATEAAIQRETMMRRLEQGLQYNEENGEVRLGTLLYQLAQQRYSKPELVALTGIETEKELDEFDEVEKDTDTGLPMMGKRYRTIPATHRLKMGTTRRKDENGGYKYYLTKSEEGARSFIAHPQFIRSSDIRVVISSGRRAGEVRAIAIEQSRQAIELFIQLYQLTVPGPTGAPPTVTPEDLPNLKEALVMYMRALGWNPEKMIGQDGGKEVSPEEKEQDAAIEEYMANKIELNPPVMPPQEAPLDPATLNTPTA